MSGSPPLSSDATRTPASPSQTQVPQALDGALIALSMDNGRLLEGPAHSHSHPSQTPPLRGDSGSSRQHLVHAIKPPYICIWGVPSSEQEEEKKMHRAPLNYFVNKPNQGYIQDMCLRRYEKHIPSKHTRTHTHTYAHTVIPDEFSPVFPFSSHVLGFPYQRKSRNPV